MGCNTPGPPPNTGKTTYYTVPIGDELTEEHLYGLASNISPEATNEAAHREAITIATRAIKDGQDPKPYAEKIASRYFILRAHHNVEQAVKDHQKNCLGSRCTKCKKECPVCGKPNCNNGCEHEWHIVCDDCCDICHHNKCTQGCEHRWHNKCEKCEPQGYCGTCGKKECDSGCDHQWHTPCDNCQTPENRNERSAAPPPESKKPEEEPSQQEKRGQGERQGKGRKPPDDDSSDSEAETEIDFDKEDLKKKKKLFEETETARFLEKLVTSITNKPDTGKRIPIKTPEAFDGTYGKFRVWKAKVDEYIRMNKIRIPTDQDQITVIGTLMSGTAGDWHQHRWHTLKARKIIDTWQAYEEALTDRFTDKQEKRKDHEKLLNLKYNGDIQTFLNKWEELNSRVLLAGEAARRAILGSINETIFDALHRKHDRIPEDDIEFLEAIRNAGIYVEERDAAKKQWKGITHGAPRNTENRTNTSPQKNGEWTGTPRSKDSERKSSGRKTCNGGHGGHRRSLGIEPPSDRCCKNGACAAPGSVDGVSKREGEEQSMESGGQDETGLEQDAGCVGLRRQNTRGRDAGVYYNTLGKGSCVL